MPSIRDIKTVKDPLSKSYLMLRYKNNTLQGIWRRTHGGYVYYVSDTFSKNYETITEAKKHTLIVCKEKMEEIDTFNKSFEERTGKK